eukprot:TRINITY_DN7359_c0_g1_i1.p1 TRINITY_DN7359_c0_g1~~TRINITY_DN7359_c0_g1_i1.p1  ORF type:complete len:241 (-),score=31.80 TRINITY_DN7359_c0_g1_i1:785-1507(-)
MARFPIGGLPQGSPLSAIACKISFCPPKVDHILGTRDYSHAESSIEIKLTRKCSSFDPDPFPGSLTFPSSRFQLLHQIPLQIQGQLDFEAAERRTEWLKILAHGREGMNIETMHVVYLAMVRSKLDFCLLLETEGRYAEMLNKQQNRALSIRAGALPSKPITALRRFLDVPLFEDLMKARGFTSFANAFDAQVDEFWRFYVEEYGDEWYHESPFGFFSFAEHIMAANYGRSSSEIEGRGL